MDNTQDAQELIDNSNANDKGLMPGIPVMEFPDLIFEDMDLEFNFF